jgi:hypothetical protein
MEKHTQSPIEKNLMKSWWKKLISNLMINEKVWTHGFNASYMYNPVKQFVSMDIGSFSKLIIA